MTRIAGYVAWLAVLSLGTANNVRADPITITAGTFLVAGPFTVAPIVLQGTRGFSLDASADVGEGRVDPFLCHPCPPGSPLSVGANVSGPAFTGTATLEGVSYIVVPNDSSPVGLALEFTGALTLPAVANGPAIVRAPFSLEGLFFPPTAEGSLRITGGGVATVFLSAFDVEPGTSHWEVDQVRYDFGVQQAPIPEPASLLLLGVAAAATFARARSRTRG